PDRDPSVTPLIQVMYSVGKHDPMITPDLPGVNLTPIRIDRGFTKFDLIVGMTDGPDWMIEGAEYSSDLFDAATVQRLLVLSQPFPEAVAGAPHLRLSALPLWPQEERRQVVVEWNATKAEVPAGACVHQLIAGQAARTPAAPAVVCGGQALTYA